MKVTLSSVGKKYGSHWVFRHANAEFVSGGTYGIVGFNGSGKSTLLQIISGYVTPSEGTISFDHLTVDQVHAHLSMAAPYLDLLEEFNVRESIKLQARFKPFQNGILPEGILREMELEPHADKLLSELSSGMRQRLKLALAIYANTSILLLDEPCANLDAKWTAWFNECLKKHSPADRLVIICSNNQQEELKMVNREMVDVSAFHSATP